MWQPKSTRLAANKLGLVNLEDQSPIPGQLTDFSKETFWDMKHIMDGNFHDFRTKIRQKLWIENHEVQRELVANLVSIEFPPLFPHQARV